MVAITIKLSVCFKNEKKSGRQAMLPTSQKG